jgi:hypothetical protein
MRLPLLLAVAISLASLIEADLVSSSSTAVEWKERRRRRRLKGSKDEIYHDNTHLVMNPFEGEIPFFAAKSSKSKKKEGKDKGVYTHAYVTTYSDLDQSATDYISEPNTRPIPLYDAKGKPITIVRKKYISDASKKAKDTYGKMDKLIKISPTGSKGSKGTNAGKQPGKGSGTYPPKPSRNCTSPIARSLLGVDELITQNPARCCDYDGPTAVYVTHARRDDSTPSGLEVFWDSFYTKIASVSDLFDVCFVMSGFDPEVYSNKTLDEILISAITVASDIPIIPSIMTTDPTEDVLVVQKVREVTDAPLGPNIGIFNAGYANIVLESIVTGFDRLPFVGLIDDSTFGAEAAKVTTTLLQGTEAKPVCFNPRIGLQFLAQRCEAYYSGVTDQSITPTEGVSCGSNSTVQQILDYIIANEINAVWTHVECCFVVGQAVQRARQMGRSIVAGCQDADTTNGMVNFVTAQPIKLEAFNVATWASFPVIQAMQGKDGRGGQVFPGLQSLVNTAVYSVLIL